MIWDIFRERNKARSFQSYECLICIHERLIAHCIAEPPAPASSTSEGRPKAVWATRTSSSPAPLPLSDFQIETDFETQIISHLVPPESIQQSLGSGFLSPAHLWAQWFYPHSPRAQCPHSPSQDSLTQPCWTTQERPVSEPQLILVAFFGMPCPFYISLRLKFPSSSISSSFHFLHDSSPETWRSLSPWTWSCSVWPCTKSPCVIVCLSMHMLCVFLSVQALWLSKELGHIPLSISALVGG